MLIVHEDNNIKGRFFINEDGEDLAVMTYKWHGDTEINIDHTQVDEQLKGQGIAGKLLAEAVKWAREEDIKIYPSCPYVKAAFEKKPEEYKDVFSPDFN